ncbi:hypothetical protein M9458_017665, partial [Cirrhinus mrigala]
DSDYLSLGLSSYRSWWKDNGPGCENRNLPTTRWQHLEKYQYIEVMHSALQLFISVRS